MKSKYEMLNRKGISLVVNLSIIVVGFILALKKVTIIKGNLVDE